MSNAATETEKPEKIWTTTPKKLRQTIYWLALDWIGLHRDLPTPPKGETTRTSNTRECGHPAEWASDSTHSRTNSSPCAVASAWKDSPITHALAAHPQSPPLNSSPKAIFNVLTASVNFNTPSSPVTPKPPIVTGKQIGRAHV